MRQLIYAREQEVDLATQLQRLQLPADAEAVEWNTNSSSRQPLDSDDSDQVSNTVAALQLPADAEAVEWNTNSSSSRQPLDSDDSVIR